MSIKGRLKPEASLDAWMKKASRKTGNNCVGRVSKGLMNCCTSDRGGKKTAREERTEGHCFYPRFVLSS